MYRQPAGIVIYMISQDEPDEATLMGASAMKTMKTKPRRGFTLIEMLMVVTVIGILVLLLVASIGGASRSARDSRVRAEITALEQAFRSYVQLYGRFPRHTDYGSGMPDPEGERILTVNWNMVRMLRGEDRPSGMNPRRVAFMDIADASLNDNQEFADAWGAAYRYMFDFNQDGRIDGPDVWGYGPNDHIHGRSIIVWSRGPPDDRGRWRNPIKSWE